MRQYLAGRAELVQLPPRGGSWTSGPRDLRGSWQRQADPAYAERQARERLTYVLPGDRLVVVVDGSAVEGDAGTLAGGRPTADQLPWYEGLLESLRSADGDSAHEPAR